MRSSQLICVLAFLFVIGPATAQDWFLPRTTIVMPVRYVDPEECAGLLRTMVPDAKVSVMDRRLKFEGTAGALDQVLELLVELDRPLDDIILDLRLAVWERTSERGLDKAQFSDGLSFELFPSPCFGDSDARLRLLEARGKLRVVSSNRVETRLGKSVAINLTGSQREMTLNAGVKLDGRGRVMTSLRFSSKRGGPVRGLEQSIPDGSTLVIWGFAEERSRSQADSEEFILFLTPHLMR